MDDHFASLLPLVVSVGIMAIGFWETLKNKPPNRLLGGGLILVGSLFWWMASALMLIYRQQYERDGHYFLIQTFTVLLPFMGVALMIPRPAGATRFDQRRLPAHVLMWTGFVLGSAYAIVVCFIGEWQSRLIDFYVSLEHRAAALILSGFLVFR